MITLVKHNRRCFSHNFAWLVLASHLQTSPIQSPQDCLSQEHFSQELKGPSGCCLFVYTKIRDAVLLMKDQLFWHAGLYKCWTWYLSYLWDRQWVFTFTALFSAPLPLFTQSLTLDLWDICMLINKIKSKKKKISLNLIFQKPAHHIDQFLT